jgi:YjbR
LTEFADVPVELVARLRSVCLALPDAYQEQAWVGTRWRVRKRTFAHVLAVDSQWPPAYARASDADGPTVLLTFRSPADELDALVATGHPYFKPQWSPSVIGMIVEPDVDWDEVAELLMESYCLLAPKKLVALVHRPAV